MYIYRLYYNIVIMITIGIIRTIIRPRDVCDVRIAHLSQICFNTKGIEKLTKR